MPLKKWLFSGHRHLHREWLCYWIKPHSLWGQSAPWATTRVCVNGEWRTGYLLYSDKDPTYFGRFPSSGGFWPGREEPTFRNTQIWGLFTTTRLLFLNVPFQNNLKMSMCIIIEGAWGLTTFQQLTDIVKHLAYANFCPLSGVFSQTSSLDGVYSVSFHLDIEPLNFLLF